MPGRLNNTPVQAYSDFTCRSFPPQKLWR